MTLLSLLGLAPLLYMIPGCDKRQDGEAPTKSHQQASKRVGSGISDNLSMTLHCKDAYKAGEEITISLELNNTGKEDIAYGCRRGTEPYQLEVKREGKDVPLTKRGFEMSQVANAPFGSRISVIIEPGGAPLKKDIPVGLFYDLGKTGRYAVEVSLSCSKESEPTCEYRVKRSVSFSIE